MRIMPSLKTAIELLDYFTGCPFTIDHATVPAGGIEAAPEQVVVNLSVSWIWVLAARKYVKRQKKKDLIIQLTNALEALVSCQNGPPLIRESAAWEDAMREVEQVLAEVKRKTATGATL